MTRIRKVLTLVGAPVVVVGGLVAIKQSFFTDRHAQVILFGIQLQYHNFPKCLYHYANVMHFIFDNF